MGEGRGGLKPLKLTPEPLRVKAGETAGSLEAGGHTPQRTPHTLGFPACTPGRHLHTPHPSEQVPWATNHLLQRGCSSSYSEIIIKEEVTNLAVLFSLLILNLLSVIGKWDFLTLVA